AALAQNIPGTAARVNGVEISNFRLERHFEEYLKNQRRNVSSMINPRVYKKLKSEALDQLIEREILWQAAQAEGVVLDDQELKTALAQMQAQVKDQAAWSRRLAHAGFDERSYAEYVRQDLSGSRYLLRKSSDVPPVSDDDVAAFYRANLHRFQQPETARARHILIKATPTAEAQIRVRARQRIDALAAELRAGADFADLARRHSEDNSAAQGGDLGEVPRGRTVKPFEDALFALRPGQISDVVETQFGFHLIRLESLTPASTRPLDEVSESIRARLLAEKRTAAAREVVARLKADARIERLAMLD
ncbi:MAG: peptidylprolyl isomerase, partial [Burkholderiaceae bacterium]|nr:peptidylprolyl isomerase [Burkholderiaceae bacterium]